MIDREKRKRVMQRSIRLGRCICNPKQPCPCDLFKQKNICTCAGERLQSPSETIQLTKTVEKAGCASKIDQAFLKLVLKSLPSIEDPRIIIGVPAGDDAGVYDMGQGKALVQTVDVFTPSVDDPYLFGQVAAANSVSDIYAMGGTPMTALSIIGFPARKIPDHAMNDILRGGIDKMNEAGVAIIGGHSIDDDQIKAGFAVTGLIDKDRIVTNAGAKPGDVLILTKPLGTGIVAFAAQIGKASSESIRAAGESMTTLNRSASELMVKFGVHACTDVTGFGLMGHLTEMAASSGVDVEVIWDEIPLLPGVLDYAGAGILPGAIERNKESCSRQVKAEDALPQEMVDICYDAQTSGGLLISISKVDADKFHKALFDAGVAQAAVIGKVVGRGSGRIFLRTTGRREIPQIESNKSNVGVPSESEQSSVPAPAMAETAAVACCADAAASPAIRHPLAEGGTVATGSPIDEVKAKFKDFLSYAGSPHGLDAYTKQAIAIALSVALRCEPCLKMHLKNARNKGFTQDEIDEAAWMGISFGGSPTMVFYEQLKNQ
jgi:selenide,water dikinase